jgi:putative lipoprotein
MNRIRCAAILFALLISPFALAAQSAPPSAPSASGSATITGSAMYRERIALPPAAVLEATLEDSSLADAPAIKIASTKHDRPGNPPFRFTITYDPAKIVDSHSYSVRVTITLDGKLMFTSTVAAPVITNGSPNHVSLALHHVTAEDATPAVASRGVAADALENTYWKLVTLNGKEVVVPPNHREPSLILHPEGMRTEVFGGCNSIAGTYKLSGKNLTFGPMAGTLMACPEGMDTEKDFTAALADVRTYRIYGKHLDLFDEHNKTLAHFESRPTQ